METKEKILIGTLIFVFVVLALILGIILLGHGFKEILSKEGYIAVIPLKGEIVGECDNKNCIDPKSFKDMVEKAEQDNSVKAILIDVDSGGGEVVASKELMEIIKKAKEKKPVVAYIRRIGASGAYYAISASNYIVANEYSLTGSIGVKTVIYQYKGLMDKLGINVTVIKRPKNKDVAAPYNENLSEEEMKLFEEIIDEIYNGFVNDVAENRKLSRERVIEISENRSIYLGKRAKEVKLVDEVGNFDKAMKIAGDIAKIENPLPKYYYPKDFGNELFEKLALKIGEGIGKEIKEIIKTENIEIKSE